MTKAQVEGGGNFFKQLGIESDSYYTDNKKTTKKCQKEVGEKK